MSEAKLGILAAKEVDLEVAKRLAMSESELISYHRKLSLSSEGLFNPAHEHSVQNEHQNS